MLEEKAQKKKSKKASKPAQEPKPETQTRKPSLDLKKTVKAHKKKLQITFAVIVSLLLVIFAVSLLQRIFRPADIAKFLPEDAVVLLATINTNEKHDQHIKAVNLLKDHQFSKENLIARINQSTPYDYKTDIAPWLGRQAGLALLKDSDKKLQTYIFAEFTTLDLAQKFQQKFPNQSFIIDDYLVFGPENPLSDQIKKTSSPLSENEQYQNTVSHLPFNQAASLYINFPLLSDDLLQKIPFIQSKTLSINEIKPILNTLNSEGLTLQALDENFALQSYLALSEEKIDQAVTLKSKSNYSGQLLKLLDQNVVALWGGENLENRLRVLLEILTGGTEENALLFDKIVEQYTEKYFGPSVNFNRDILPLFRKEFAFALEDIDGKQTYKFLLEVSFPEKDAERLHEIANSFASIGAVFEPKVVEHTLPDGTIAKEIVAIPEKILKAESSYKDHKIHELQMGSQGWGIYYSLIDDIAIFSDSKISLQRSLDLLDNSAGSLTKTATYSRNIAPILDQASELTYLNFEKIPQFGLNKFLKNLATGNAYFEGGIMSINYFDL